MVIPSEKVPVTQTGESGPQLVEMIGAVLSGLLFFAVVF